jgi:hypothetical protein
MSTQLPFGKSQYVIYLLRRGIVATMIESFQHTETGFRLMPFEATGSADDFVERMWRPRHLLTLNAAYHHVGLPSYRAVVGSLAKRVHNGLFLCNDDERARSALFEWRDLVYQTVCQRTVSHRLVLWAPVGTMELFDDALARGLITRVAWSAAVRLCYLDYAAPDPFDGSRTRRFLEPLASADDRGLMSVSERAHVAALPEVVTLYRTALTHTVEQAASGISWTIDRNYIDRHIEHTDEVARRNNAPEGTYSTAKGWQHAGRRQWAVECQFPRSAIRAWIEAHGHEYLVDFRMMIPGSMRTLRIHQLYPSAASIEAARQYLARISQDQHVSQ